MPIYKSTNVWTVVAGISGWPDWIIHTALCAQCGGLMLRLDEDVFGPILRRFQCSLRSILWPRLTINFDAAKTYLDIINVNDGADKVPLGLRLALHCRHVCYTVKLSKLLNLPRISDVLNGSPNASRSTPIKSYFSFPMNEAN